MYTTFGEAVHDYRVKHHMSLSDLAKVAGLSKAYIAVLERGENYKTGKPVMPTVPVLRKLASAMGLTLHEILKLVPTGEIDLGDAEAIFQKIREQEVELDPEARMIAEAYQMADDYPRRIVRTVLEPYFPKGG